MNKIENKAIRLFPKMPNAELKMDLTFVKLINLKISLSIEDSGLRKWCSLSQISKSFNGASNSEETASKSIEDIILASSITRGVNREKMLKKNITKSNNVTTLLNVLGSDFPLMVNRESPFITGLPIRAKTTDTKT